MRTKLKVAYEPESSLTARLTPEDVGVLLNHMDAEQLKRTVKAMHGDMIYSTEEHVKKVFTAIKEGLEDALK